MTKFFVISDVHGFYEEMREALDKAGFDPNNENHWLISCGDHMDRGDQPRQVINYLTKLPRKVLIKGNHESLIMDCIERECPYKHDWHNGTAKTIIDLAPYANTFDEACATVYWGVSKFIDGMVNYFETQNYIFVHAFVPLNCEDNLPPYITHNRKYSKMDNWREAHAMQWEDARWGNPFELAEQGLLPDKTLVFGHWHASTGWAKLEGRSELGEDAKYEPFYGDRFIAIDACTARSGIVNVVVIEDEMLGVDDNHNEENMEH